MIKFRGEIDNPPSKETIEMAEKFLAMMKELLPANTPDPDIIAEDDGEIGIEWYNFNKPNNVISISIGSHGKINYAAYFHYDHSKDHGCIDINEDLSHLVNLIKKVYIA